jgi:glycosyltransferase involved in cell wall biosynthesis
MTSTGPLVSIVLPVHNGERYLRESLDSCLRQTYPHWELIAVDDCSSDSSPRILAEYAASDPRIRVLRNEHNLRLPKSLNVGFAHAKGEILTWTSDDNNFLPPALERMVRALQDHPDVALVYASQEFIDDNGQHRSLQMAEDPETLCHFNTVNACFAYRRVILEKLGGYDDRHRLVEDWEYWLRIAREHKLLPLRECLYQYRQHGSSLTIQHGETRWLAEENMLADALPRLRAKWPRGCARGWLRLAHERWRHDQRWRAWNYFWRALGCAPDVTLGEWRILLPLTLGKYIYYGLQARLPWLRITRA